MRKLFTIIDKMITANCPIMNKLETVIRLPTIHLDRNIINKLYHVKS